MRVLLVIFALLAVTEINPVSARDEQTSGQNPNTSSVEQQRRILEWMQNTHNSIQQQLVIEEEFLGHEVKYQVRIDIFGNVVDVKLLKSSGNGGLEKYAKVAILRSQPLDLSQLNEHDFARAQVFNVVIAPK
ncbi:TonB C-terminal domain-containing protein [Vibrio vulnificus]|uniref:energy transducer TonB n=1 Tax=Vibrio vulnificus TaxID=672 RepID=UPI003030DA5B